MFLYSQHNFKMEVFKITWRFASLALDIVYYVSSDALKHRCTEHDMNVTIILCIDMKVECNMEHKVTLRCMFI